jgi:hypothetical protein
MALPLDSWKVFWQREADELCQVMPIALVGGSAITTICFQSVGLGRLVYLTRNQAGQSAPIILDSGPDFARIFNNPDDLPLPKYFTMSADISQIYGKLDRTALLALYDEEVRRYGPTLYDADTLMLRGVTESCLQVAFPSPLHHESKDWWNRLPRLGSCYSLENKLAHKEGLSGENQAKTSQLVLQTSAMHAGNRIMSKRLGLLFENTYSWEVDKKVKKDEKTVAENISRALCIVESKTSSKVTHDQKLYLITKLLVAHHLFFPHSPEALKAFEFLGKDPNGDVLIPHEWEPVHYFESTATDLRQCVERLVKDVTLLVRAFNRWDRPESVKRVPDSTLESEIQSLVKEALGILCGSISWAEGGEFLSLLPPKGLLPLGEISMPAITKSQTTRIFESRDTGSKAFYPFMQQLAPLSVRVPTERYKISLSSIVHSTMGSNKPKDSEVMLWLSKYFRARIEYADRTKAILEELPSVEL